MQRTLLTVLALVAALLSAEVSASIWFRDLRTRAPITGTLYLPLSYTGTTIGISLRERPPNPVVVSWGADIAANGNRNGTLFPGNQKCTAVFTPTNWNVTQSVTLANPMRALLPREALTAPVRFQSFSSECGYSGHGSIVDLHVNRQAFPNTQCFIKTTYEGGAEGMNVRAFGEVAYHFMGQGSYYILRSDSVAVITDSQRCRVKNGGGACMTRLAIVLDGSTIYFDPINIVQSRLAKSSAPMSMSVPPASLPTSVSIAKYEPDPLTRSESITLQLRTGLSIQFNVTGGDRPAINDLLIRPDLELSQRGATNGWCGAFDASLPWDKPVTRFRAGNVMYESMQLFRDSSTVPRTSAKYAATTLVKFVESTRVPANLNPFSSGYVPPKMTPMGSGLMTGACPAVNHAEYACAQTRSGIRSSGFVRAGLASQSAGVEGESSFAAALAHCLDSADCGSAAAAAGELDGANDTQLFSVEEGSGLSDAFTDAVDQFWDEFGLDE